MKHYFFQIFLVALLFFSSCQPFSSKEEVKIGFSQCTMGNAWRQQMANEMHRELMLFENIDYQLEIKDAQGKTEKQLSDIRSLVAQDIDILLVSPNEKSQDLSNLLDSVVSIHIPVILIDRYVETKNNVFFITTKNDKIGRSVGKEVLRLLPDGGYVTVFSGLRKSSSETLRHDNMRRYLSNKTDYVFLRIAGDWTEEKAYKDMADLVRRNIKTDLIIAHNDFMARGAIRAMQDGGYPLPPIISVGGINTPHYGIDMVLNTPNSSTITYPTGGDVAMQLVHKIHTEDISPYNIELESIVINKLNVKAIKQQRDEVEAQFEKLDLQNKRIEKKEQKIKQQRKVYSLITLSLILGYIIFLLIRNNKNQLTVEDEVPQYKVPILPDAKKDEIEFILYIEKIVTEHISESEVDVQFLSEKLDTSHSTLYRKAKKITGCSIAELIKIISLNTAAQLLKESNMNIEEIAQKTGFNSASYFSTRFAKQFGVSPSEFRKG